MPGHATDLLAGHPTDTCAAALLQAVGPGSAAPWPGGRGELQRSLACCGSGCFQALPFTSHLSRQAHAGSSEHCFAGAQGSEESKSHRLSAAKPGLRSFASFIRAMLLRLPAAQQPVSLPITGHCSSQWLWTSIALSRLGLLLLSDGAELGVSILQASLSARGHIYQPENTGMSCPITRWC